MLFMKRHSMAICSENEIVVDLYLKSDNDFEKLYPNYGLVLNWRYRRGRRRKKLMRMAKKSLENATGLDIPEICTEKIFGLINDWDLMILGETEFQET